MRRMRSLEDAKTRLYQAESWKQLQILKASRRSRYLTTSRRTLRSETQMAEEVQRNCKPKHQSRQRNWCSIQNKMSTPYSIRSAPCNTSSKSSPPLTARLLKTSKSSSTIPQSWQRSSNSKRSTSKTASTQTWLCLARRQKSRSTTYSQ